MFVIKKSIINEKIMFAILLMGILLFHLAMLQSYFYVEIDYSDNESGSMQLFYDDGETGFLESKSVISSINPERITDIRVDTKEIRQIRLDFDGMEKMSINAIKIMHGKNIITEINPQSYNNYILLEHDCLIENEQDVLRFISNGNDSYLVFDIGHITGDKLFFIVRAIFRLLKYLCIVLLLLFIGSIDANGKLCHANNRFILLACLFGLIYSFAIIPWQTPDEWTHLKMIGNGFNNPSLVEALKNDMPFYEHFIKSNSQAKINFSDFISVMTKKPSYTLVECMPKGISYEFFRHFPAAIGIMSGILLRLPTYWVMQLGELFSLSFYIIVCNYALKLTPIKKELFEVTMLLPMCIQQMASINYDSVLLPLSFFFVSYILYLKYEKEKIRGIDFIVLCAALAIITLTKLPYVSFGLMILILPWNKIAFEGRLKRLENINKSLRIYGGGGLLFLSVLIGLYVLRNYYYVKLFITSTIYFPRTIQLFSDTLKYLGDELLLTLLGKFGWLDTTISLRLTMIIFSILAVSAFITTNSGIKEKNKLSLFEKLIIIVCIMSMIYMVSLSQVKHSILIFHLDNINDNTVLGFKKILHTIPYIVGLQGRYYIPMILPIGILFQDLYKTEKESYSKFILIIESLILTMTSLTIIQRYFV